MTTNVILTFRMPLIPLYPPLITLSISSMWITLCYFYVLCYFVLPSRSGSRTLGIKDTLLLLLLLLLLLTVIRPTVKRWVQGGPKNCLLGQRPSKRLLSRTVTGVNAVIRQSVARMTDGCSDPAVESHIVFTLLWNNITNSSAVKCGSAFFEWSRMFSEFHRFRGLSEASEIQLFQYCRSFWHRRVR